MDINLINHLKFVYGIHISDWINKYLEGLVPECWDVVRNQTVFPLLIFKKTASLIAKFIEKEQ